jgi:hypothetical protein
MATGPQILKRFAPLLGKGGLASFDKNLRSQRATGQIPTTKTGGGAHTVHFGQYPVAYILLGMSATASYRAAEAASDVASLDWEIPQPGDASGLLNVLAGEIERRAIRINNGMPPSDGRDDWSLTVCLKPLRAWVSITVDGQEVRRNFQSPKSIAAPWKGLQRLTVINSYLLNVAAELVADTLAKREGQTKTAAPPARGTAVTNRDHEKQASPSPPRRSFTRTGEGSQPRSHRGPAQPAKSSTSRVTHDQPTDYACPG